ncbi:MAG: type II secretion system F family protein [Burkholderiales bacterium]
MKLSYRARDAQGQLHQGQLEASNEAEAVQQLAAQGLTPVALEGQAAPAVKRATGRVKAADQVLLLRELATLLKAGVTLGDALPSLAEAYRTQAIGPALERLNTGVRGGGRLSEGLADPQLQFPAFVLALAQAGEASGQLASSLNDAAAQMELDRKSSEELRSALIYPTVLVVAGLLAVFIVFVGVVPRFAPMLRSTRGEMPELSRWVIETGVFVRAHLGAFGFGLGALLALVGVGAQSATLRQQVLQALLKLPGIGPWLLQAEIGRWATVLGALLANRVPIVEALQLSSKVLKFDLMRSGVERACRSLQQGQTLAASLETQGWFPPTRLNLIRVGERSGELPAMLLALGEAQTETARTTQKRLLTLIEPAAILIIGAVIGVVMVAVMMAITGMNQVAG